MHNTALVFISLVLIGSVLSTAVAVIGKTSQMKKGIGSYVLAEQSVKTNYRRPAVVIAKR